MDSTAFQVIAILAIIAQGLLLFLALFEPTLRYKISQPPAHPLDSDQFLKVIAALADAKVHRNTLIQVLTNGEAYYEAELEAIRNAKKSINLEAYIFQKGEVTRRFVEALTERARAGVNVNVVLDAIGSFATWNSYFRELTEAGGRVSWYHGFKWHQLPRLNNRTHREIIVVDCEVGFVGGAGFADHWLISKKKEPRWRDTMFRVEGEGVSSIQSTFVENWLEATGELLTGDEYFCFHGRPCDSAMMIVDSSVSSGQSTRARMLFQTLMASAQDFIEITTPYFLPDAGIRKELCRALRDRGVKVRVVCPGDHNDHTVTRRSSRRLYGELLKAGAEIHEYQTSMIHTKSMVIDGKWSVVGSTNLDHRSFSINDEVNLASNDAGLAARLREDFARDVAESKCVTYEEWKRRSIFERLHEGLGRLLERQQ
ncbi:MAG TPA: phospholipase D-like domain-containing protein [Bryobacteraceae bacterium]|nr:phospholipase D-like domain-containing protein [Bryobacteraceae bacterium]